MRPADDTGRSVRRWRLRFAPAALGAGAVCLALLGVYCSSESLWIDEAYTAWFAGAPSFRTLLERLAAHRGSEVQMPLYILLAWLFAQVLGTGEFALRAPNILYGALALVAMARIGRGSRLRLPWLLMVASPFFAYHVNEARPYTLVLACGAWSLHGAVAWFRRDGRSDQALLLCLGACLPLCASHMLGVLWLVAVSMAVAIVSLRRHWLPRKRTAVVIALYFAVLMVLGGYYAWTLSRGAGGAKLWKPGLQNVLYALYEFSGGSGLGPPRALLRAQMAAAQRGGAYGLAALAPHMLGLAALGALYLLILLGLRRRRRADAAEFLFVGALACLATFLLSVAAFAFRWPFWGRHLSFVFPAFVLWVSDALERRNEPSTRRRWLGLALAGLFLAGSFNQRFSAGYRKDDYREAVRLARAELVQGRTVWWAADGKTAGYYGLLPGTDPGLVDAGRKPMDVLQASPAPALVLLSKPDLFDRSGAIRRYLAENRFQRNRQLSAFDVWTRSPAELPD